MGAVSNRIYREIEGPNLFVAEKSTPTSVDFAYFSWQGFVDNYRTFTAANLQPPLNPIHLLEYALDLLVE